MNELPIEKRYRPIDDTDLLDFEYDFCEKCLYSPICGIRQLVMSLGKSENMYPEDWTYDTENNPICTKFEKVE